MVSENPPATILGLPLDLREDIYDYIFLNTHIEIRPYWDQVNNKGRKAGEWTQCETYPDRTVPCPTLAIAQTCSSMRPEALIRFYRHATFHCLGVGHIVAQLNKMPEIMRNTVAESMTENTLMSIEAEDELALKPALDTQKEVLKNMQRLIDDLGELPYVFFDLKQWTWDDRALHESFSNLKELRLDFMIQCCRCDYVPLAVQYGVVSSNAEYNQLLQQTNNPRDRRRMQQQHELNDGQFIRNLTLKLPLNLRIWFEMYMMDTCTANGATTIVLEPNSDPTKAKVIIKDWFNYCTCNDYLVELLHDYGAHDEAVRMEKMIEDGAADEISN